MRTFPVYLLALANPEPHQNRPALLSSQVNTIRDCRRALTQAFGGHVRGKDPFYDDFKAA